MEQKGVTDTVSGGRLVTSASQPKKSAVLRCKRTNS